MQGTQLSTDITSVKFSSSWLQADSKQCTQKTVPTWLSGHVASMDIWLTEMLLYPMLSIPRNLSIYTQKDKVLKGDDKIGHHSEATQARPLASVTAAEPPWSSVPAALSPAGPVSAAFARIGVCSAPAPAWRLSQHIFLKRVPISQYIRHVLTH